MDWQQEHEPVQKRRSTLRFNDSVEVLEYSDNTSTLDRRTSLPLRIDEVNCHVDSRRDYNSDGSRESHYSGDPTNHGVVKHTSEWSDPTPYEALALSNSALLDVDVPKHTHSRAHLDISAIRRLEHALPAGAMILPLRGRTSNPFANNPQNDGYLPPNRTVALVWLQIRSVHPITHVHTIFGRILVKNLAFEKQVFARWTIDNWHTSHDETAQFSRHYPGGWDGLHDNPGTDAFEFSIQVDTRPDGSTETIIEHMNRMGKEWAQEDTQPQRRKSSALLVPMQLAICFRANKCEYWDNNEGANYALSLSTI